MDRYSVTIAWSDRDKAFVASVPEFPNLYAFGATKAEALAQEEDALAAYAELHKEKGVPLPMPEKRPAFSGQLRLRMPKTLHARLSSLAKVEGCSLNQLLLSLLSEGLGHRRASRAMERAHEVLSQWRTEASPAQDLWAYVSAAMRVADSLPLRTPFALPGSPEGSGVAAPGNLWEGSGDETAMVVFERALSDPRELAEA